MQKKVTKKIARPQPLSAEELQKALVNCGMEESQHTQKKHPTLTLVDVVCGLQEPWRSMCPQYDAKHKEWKYQIVTNGVNRKWLRIVVVPDLKRKMIRVVTRFQNER